MHLVVKGTKTIEEFKEKKSKLEVMAKRYSAEHIDKAISWGHGEPVKAWYAESSRNDGSLDANEIWIEYRDGESFRYPNEIR